jgi:GTPase Era involved in 16S rRNA processing
VFVDTPPLHSFNLDVIRSCADSCDLLLPVVDINDNDNASMLESVLKKSQKPSLLVLNKSENVLKMDTERHVERWREVMGDSVGQIMTTSALERFGTAKLQVITSS